MWLRLVGFLALVAAVAVVLLLVPVGDLLKQVVQTAREMGVWGAALLAVVYILACILFIPGSILTMGAGFAFGVVLGTATVSVGSTLGAAAAFLLGRTLARNWVARKVSGNARFRAVDEAVGKEGFKIVLLTRLSPVFPFNLLNYSFGITKVSFWRYIVASWIGMLPGTVMYVYIGSALESLAQINPEGMPKGSGELAFFWGGLSVTLIVTIYVTRLAKRAIRESIEE